MMKVVPGFNELQLLSAGSAKDLGTGHVNVLLLNISVGVAVDDEDGKKGNKKSYAVNAQPVANVALAQSEPGRSWGVLQPTPSIPAVSLGGLQGN